MQIKTDTLRWLPALVLGLIATATPAAAQDCLALAFCQDSDGVTGSYSNPGAPQLVAESFQLDAATSIDTACWWGFGSEGDGGAECGASLVAFSITYYNDFRGLPGTVKAGPFGVEAVSTPTGGTILGYDEHQFSASHFAVSVAAGEKVWIEIHNTSSCFFGWASSASGDNASAAATTGPWGAVAGDLAVCVGVAPCPFAAATSDTSTNPSPLAAARMLGRVYGLRDHVLAGTSTGRRWTRLYYRHGAAMRRILRERPRLRRRVKAFTAVIGPGIEALAQGDARADRMRVPPHAIALLHALLDEFEQADEDGELARAIRAERNVLGLTSMGGASYAGAWDRINAR